MLASFTGKLGNGVSITSVTTNTIIGGVNSGEGNIIAFNSGSGIYVIHNGTLNNSIASNSIYSNGGLGIDLGNTGVTPTDSIYNEALGIYDYDDDRRSE